jgi:hypothetical protein
MVQNITRATSNYDKSYLNSLKFQDFIDYDNANYFETLVVRVEIVNNRMHTNFNLDNVSE